MTGDDETPPRPTLPVAYSLPSADALLEEVARAYASARPTSCALYRSWANDVYRIATAEGDYFLKVYRADWRSWSEVAYEVELLAHLDARGVAVATAIARRDGQPIGTLRAPEGERRYVLFAAAEGAKPRRPFDEGLYHRFGRATARLHRASNDFTSGHARVPLDLGSLIDRPLEAIRPRLARRPDDWTYLSGLAARVRARLGVLAGRGLDWGPCHGDLSLDNVHITPDGRFTFFDFDSGGPGWRACDPYGVLQYATLDRNGFWDAFLTGYREIRPFDGADLAAVPFFVVAQTVWGMGLESGIWAKWSGLWSADDAYFDRELAALRRWDAEQLGGA